MSKSSSHPETKILFAVPTLNAGGAERVIVNYLRSLDSRRFERNLLLINKTGELLKLIPEDIKIYELGLYRTRYSLMALIDKIKKIQPEIIVSTTNRMNILLLLGSLFINKRTKVIIREPSMPSAQLREKHLSPVYYALIRILYRRAHIIIAQTEKMKEEIHQIYRIPNNRIRVIINPLDYKLIDQAITGVGSPYSENTINVVASGRLNPEKGFDVLIRAFSLVIARNPRFRLYILGKQDDVKNCSKKLFQLVDHLHLKDFVHFKGFQGNPYLYYKHADLFVLSSNWEGLPNVVLEAQYLGTPVVATNCVPILSKIIKEGENGYIVPVGDAEAMSVRVLQYRSLQRKSLTCEAEDLNEFFQSLLNL